MASRARSAVISFVVLGMFAVAFFLVSWSTVLRKSPTYDEPIHLYAGYSYLRWGDFRVNPEHPPLAKMLAALPLLWQQVNTGPFTKAQRDLVQQRKDYGWVLANQFLAVNDAETLFSYAKSMMIGLAILTGVFVFMWARELSGPAAAIAALTMYGLDPNILAHSSIVHTDLPFALCFVGGTYFFWRTCYRFTWLNLIVTSCFFGLSAITKFSSLVILPAWVLLGMLRVFSSTPQYSAIALPGPVQRRWTRFAILAVTLTTALVTAYVGIWSVYGFRFDGVPYQRGTMAVGHLVSGHKWLAAAVAVNSNYFLLPEAWVYGLLDAYRAFERSSYLLGEISDHGFSLYFPIAFAVKTPVPTLALLIVAIALKCFRRAWSIADAFLIVPVAIFFAFATWSRLNIGLRHILPLYPFLFVWLGGVVATIWSEHKLYGRGFLVLMVAWLLSSNVKIFPDYLAFFNELAGGAAHGHKLLVDSNLDWGQDLKGLKLWLDSHDVKKIDFAYFGTMDPSYYGIRATPAPGSLWPFWREAADNNVPSPYIAISATYLAGLYLQDKDTYALFRNQAPVADIGHSILVYPIAESRAGPQSAKPLREDGTGGRSK